MNDPLTLAILACLIAGIGCALYVKLRRSSAASSRNEPGPAMKPSEGVDRHPRTDDIIEQISEGVVVLDEELRPTFLNVAARSILGLQATGLPERLSSPEIVALAQRAQASEGKEEQILNFWYPNRSSIKARVTHLEPDRFLVVLQDITEEALAQKIRTEFVAHASHELKSPVAGLQTLAEALGQALEDDPDAATRFAERIAAEAGRLGRLVTDLLDLSRLEDPARIPYEQIDLSEVARHELDELEAGARSKKMSLIDRIETGIWIKGDDEQIGLMIRNLLENAIRYTADGGTVALEVSISNSTALVRVEDTGIGIPRDAQGRVFERFFRVDKARSRDRGGTGLGLAIVKHVAELHGGTVQVESELGEGSIFTISLPLLLSNDAPMRRAVG